ncbi:unnamed protein product, partial [Mesorhabditis belari]|uniref:Uncharacterized protein n=1 Tax=Mesorhabditis belari TaxID=2138241 RepID=A0AAF3F7B7_9BILA
MTTPPKLTAAIARTQTPEDDFLDGVFPLRLWDTEPNQGAKPIDLEHKETKNRFHGFTLLRKASSCLISPSNVSSATSTTSISKFSFLAIKQDSSTTAPITSPLSTSWGHSSSRGSTISSTSGRATYVTESCPSRSPSTAYSMPLPPSDYQPTRTIECQCSPCMHGNNSDFSGGRITKQNSSISEYDISSASTTSARSSQFNYGPWSGGQRKSKVRPSAKESPKCQCDECENARAILAKCNKKHLQPTNVDTSAEKKALKLELESSRDAFSPASSIVIRPPQDNSLNGQKDFETDS